MMRPARTVGRGSPAMTETNASGANSSTRFDSSVTNDDADTDAQEVWKGDDAEQDYARCHTLMRRLGRDGRKLEQWKRWLGGYYSEHTNLGHLLDKGKQKQKQWTEDDGPLPSQVDWARKGQSILASGASPTLAHVAAVLRIHGDSLLQSFIFPDSRAQFLELLGRSGLLPEMNVSLGVGWSAADIDFWSYASGLDKTVALEDAKLGELEQQREREERARTQNKGNGHGNSDSHEEAKGKTSDDLDSVLDNVSSVEAIY